MNIVFKPEDQANLESLLTQVRLKFPAESLGETAMKPTCATEVAQ